MAATGVLLPVNLFFHSLPVTIKQNEPPTELQVLYHADMPLVVNLQASPLNIDELFPTQDSVLSRSQLRKAL